MSDSENEGVTTPGVYSFEPLKAPKSTKGDVQSVRFFFKRYQEYLEKWNDRQEDGSIDQTHEPLKLIRCVDRDLRARIQKYEMRVGNDRFRPFHQ